MPRKIIDVAPPGQSEEIEVKKEYPSPKRKKTERSGEYSKKFSVGSSKKKTSFVFFAGVLCFLAVCGILYFFTDFYCRLEIYLTPVTEAKVFEDELEVNVSQQALDLQDKIAPGKFFEAEREKTAVFKTSGREVEEAKAEAVIRVYNSHNPPRSIVLRETTRFLAAEGGKIFKAPEKIYLPPATLSSGKITPSFVEVRVVAQESGEDYNIGPSKFSVPGLAGTAFYYSVWAESQNPMTGGYKKEIAAVNEQDIKNAESQLKESLLKESVNLIKTADFPEGYVLNDDFLYIKNFQFSCLEEPGDKKNEFNCSGKISVKGIAVKLSDIKEMVLWKITNEIGEGKEADLESLALGLFSKGVISESGKMILAVKTEVNVFDKIVEAGILSAVSGKTKNQIKNAIAGDFPGIKKVRLNFWPFWSRQAPQSGKRIKIFIEP